jgi:hypothetical protein
MHENVRRETGIGKSITDVSIGYTSSMRIPENGKIVSGNFSHFNPREHGRTGDRLRWHQVFNTADMTRRYSRWPDHKANVSKAANVRISLFDRSIRPKDKANARNVIEQVKWKCQNIKMISPLSQRVQLDKIDHESDTKRSKSLVGRKHSFLRVDSAYSSRNVPLNKFSMSKSFTIALMYNPNILVLLISPAKSIKRPFHGQLLP